MAKQHFFVLSKNTVFRPNQKPSCYIYDQKPSCYIYDQKPSCYIYYHICRSHKLAKFLIDQKISGSNRERQCHFIKTKYLKDLTQSVQLMNQLNRKNISEYNIDFDLLLMCLADRIVNNQKLQYIYLNIT